MDDTLENSQMRQQRVSSYFNQNIDWKLKQMNLQEEVSEWSETMKKIPAGHLKNPLDLSELSQTNQFLEISSVKDNRKKDLYPPPIQNNNEEQSANGDFLFINSITNCVYQMDDINQIFQSPLSPATQPLIDQSITNNTIISRRKLMLNRRSQLNEVISYKNRQNSLGIKSECQSNIQRMNITALAKIKYRIMQFYRNHTVFGLTKNLSQKIRSLIDDRSDLVKSQQTSNYDLSYKFQKIGKKYFKFLNQLPLLNVQLNLGFAIQLIFTFFNCLWLYLLTLLFIFSGFQAYQNNLRYCIRIFWIIEVILQLNTAPYYISAIKCDRKSIMNNYLRQKALCDIIPILFVTLQTEYLAFKIFIFLFIFLKIFNVISDLNYIQKRICINVKRYYVIQLFNLIFQMFLIGHIISCLWYLVALAEWNLLGVNSTWFDEASDGDLIWWKSYIWGLYWSLSLMTTGSNLAKTILEASFTTFILLFTTIAFGYFLNSISVILGEMDVEMQKKRKDVNVINEYMRSKRISRTLQAKVNIDLENYYLNNFKKTCEDNNEVLQKISIELKNSLLKEQNLQIINNIPFLINNFSQSLIEELSLCIQEEFYLPNQMILKGSDQNHACLIYLISGKVQLNQIEDFDSVSTKKWQNLVIDQTFGEQSFFTGQANSYSIKAIEFSKILRIDRTKFMKLLINREKDFEVFYQIKDKLLYYSDYKDLKISCPSCGSFYHLTQDCLYLHFNKEKAFQKAGYQNQVVCNRSEFSRRKKHKDVHALLEWKINQEIAKQIIKQIFIKQQYHDTQTLTQGNTEMNSEDEVYLQQETQMMNNEVTKYDVLSQKYQDNEITKKSLLAQENEFNFSKQFLSGFTADVISRTIQQENTLSMGSMTEVDVSQKEINITLTYLMNHQNQQEKEFKEIKEQGLEAIKSFLAVQSEFINSPSKIQSTLENKKKFTESLKTIKGDPFDLLKPKQTNESQDSSESDLSQVYQKMLKKIKLNKGSFQTLKSANPFLFSDESKQETHQNKMKSYSKLATELKEYKTGEMMRTLINQQSNVSNDEKEFYFNRRNIWDFDQMKDYSYYFEHGNSKYSIYKINRYLKKKEKMRK